MANVNTNPAVAHSPVTSFRGRPADAPPNEVPGPGSYSKKPKQTNRATKFGSAKRGLPINTAAVPGPGAYGIRDSLGESPRYTFRPKTTEKSRNFTPGPG